MKGLGVLYASAGLPLAEFLRLAELSESLGYEELWFSASPYQLESFQSLTLAGERTRTIRLGPGVAEVISRHPVTVAMCVATLQLATGGRAQLGLGIGAGGQEKMGVTPARPVRVLQEGIEIIRDLLAGKTLAYDGEIFHVRGKLEIPVSGKIPITIATHSPQGLRLSGRRADGVLLANYGVAAGIVASVQELREGERSARRPPGSCAVNLRLEACIDDDEADCVAAMRPRIASRFVATYPHWEYFEHLGIAITDAMRVAAEAKDDKALAPHLTDTHVRSTSLAGSAERAVAQLGPLLEQGLVQRFTLRPFAVAGKPLDATVRAFAERVWPQVERYITKEEDTHGGPREADARVHRAAEP